MQLRKQCTALALVVVLFALFSRIQAQTSTTQTNANGKVKTVQPKPAAKKTKGGDGPVSDRAIKAPRDAATGKATGNHHQENIMVTKGTGAASPAVMNAKPANSPTPKPASVRKTKTTPTK